MSDIAPIGRPGAPAPDRLSRLSRLGTIAPPPRGGDTVELSTTAQVLSKLAELPAVRQDLVERVRAEIANGTYDTPDKIDALLDRLAKDLV